MLILINIINKLGGIGGRRKRGTTEDEMAGWHHWLDGPEFEWTLGVGDVAILLRWVGSISMSDAWLKPQLRLLQGAPCLVNPDFVIADWIPSTHSALLLPWWFAWKSFIQYSCLENPMERGTWQATDHRVTKSWTWLNDWAGTLTLYLFFLIYFFNWRIIALQNSVVFCHTSIRIIHRYTHVPSLPNLPSISLPILPF